MNNIKFCRLWFALTITTQVIWYNLFYFKIIEVTPPSDLFFATMILIGYLISVKVKKPLL